MSAVALRRSTALAAVRARRSHPRVRVGGVSGGTVAMAGAVAFVLGGGVLLVTAKPMHAGIAALAGLLIGARLHSETETA